MQHRVVVSLFVIVLGFGLIAVGQAWKWIFPPKSYWTEAQAKQLIDAANELHSIEDRQVPGKSSTDQAAFSAAKERYQALSVDLEQSRTAYNRTGIYVSAAGMILLIVGLVFYMRAEETELNSLKSRRR